MTKMRKNARTALVAVLALALLASLCFGLFTGVGAITAHAEDTALEGGSATDGMLHFGTWGTIATRLKGYKAYADEGVTGNFVGDGDGATIQFDLYDHNLWGGSSDNKLMFFYRNKNLRVHGITGDPATPNVVAVNQNKTLNYFSSNGTTNPVNTFSVKETDKLFVKGYTYRVTFLGSENSFTISRRPISAHDDDEFEVIIKFIFNTDGNGFGTMQASSLYTDCQATWAGMMVQGRDAANNRTFMLLDNLAMWRPSDEANTKVSQDFAGEMTFKHEAIGTGNFSFAADWEKWTDASASNNEIGYYDYDEITENEKIFMYYQNNAGGPIKITEKVGGSYEANLTVTYKNVGGDTYKEYKTYNGGIVPYVECPVGYIWQYNGSEFNADNASVLQNVTSDMVITMVRDPNAAEANTILYYEGLLGTQYDFGARLEGSTGACIEFDLYKTNFFMADYKNWFNGREAAADRMYGPQITFFYGRSSLHGLQIYGNDIQNQIQFFPTGEFQSVTWHGSANAIDETLIDGDPKLFMQPGYSYRVEMRDGNAEELPNSFVVSRKEIFDPADCYEKILSFDFIAPVVDRDTLDDGTSFVGIHKRVPNSYGQYTLYLDNLSFGRYVGDPKAVTEDFEEATFDPGVQCNTLERYPADADLGDDWFEGSWGNILFRYKKTGGSYTSGDFALQTKYNEHELVFKVDGEEDKTVKVYDGAVYTGPKQVGYTYTWDWESAGIDPTNITKGGTVTGTKAVAKYTVTFIPGRGTGTLDPVTVEYGSKITLNGSAFTREGYTLSGWATTKTGDAVYAANEEITVTKDMTLYAIYTRNKYNVKFVVDGEVVQENSIQHGNYAEYYGDEPTKEGYVFTGWDFDFEENVITADTVITAQFEKVAAPAKKGCNAAVDGSAATAAAILIIAAAAVLIIRKKRAVK